MITYEQYDNEIYIVEGDDLLGRIYDMGRNNYFLIWEDTDIKIPFHGLGDVKQYVIKHYKDHI
jgi:hypothetical protein